MNIKRYAVFFSALLSVFLTFSAVTPVFASDDVSKGTSPSDSSVKVLMPEKTDSAEKQTIKHSDSLSYGLDIIRRGRKLKKTSVRDSIPFQRTDFEEFSGAAVNYITVRTLPDQLKGTLKLGALDVFAGQRIPSALIDKLVFIPGYTGASAEFTFSLNGEEDVSLCVMTSLYQKNTPPSVQTHTVYTKSGIRITSALPVTDRDGDKVVFTVLKQPEHGSLELASDGSFSYRPHDGYVGKDSFICAAEDEYGGVSGPVAVPINVGRNRSGIVYSDMKDDPAEYAAYLLAERGIFKGSTVAGVTSFEPDKNVSPAEFIVMALKAAGYSPDVYSAVRSVSGREDLSAEERGYLATAASAKIIEFLPASITVGEAKKIASSLTEASPVFSGVSPDDEPLCRSDAAVLLAAVIDGNG